jgi:glycosyltransferase involved in cell wall biosynthesis
MSELERQETETYERRSVVIAHAVAKRKAVPRRYGARRVATPLRIGFLGRNVPKKGINRIFEAMAAERKSHWELLIAGPAGSTSFESVHRRIAEDLRVSGRISGLGYVETQQDLFDRCDVLVMPSEYEGFGMSAAKAMAAGVPVIVPRESGVAELVSEFEAGLVVE